MTTTVGYFTESDYYQALVNQYGPRLPWGVAERIARQNGVELNALVADGLAVSKSKPLTVSAADLLLALGY